MMNKLKLSTLGLVIGISLTQQQQPQVDELQQALNYSLTQCEGQFQEEINLLFMNCFDDAGNVIDRYQRLYVRPLEQQCQEVPRESLPAQRQGTATTQATISLQQDGFVIAPAPATVGQDGFQAEEQIIETEDPTIIVPQPVTPEPTVEPTVVTPQTEPIVITAPDPIIVTPETEPEVTTIDTEVEPVPVVVPEVDLEPSPEPLTEAVNCCDYFIRGVGYEFSDCDGWGAIVREDMIGSEMDLQFQAMEMDEAAVSPLWQELDGLIDNLCQIRQEQAQTPDAPPITLTEIWQAIGFDFSPMQNQTLDTMEDMNMWLEFYTQFIDALRFYVQNIPETRLGQEILQELQAEQPENLEGLTMQQLTTVYRPFYESFINWFDRFFGAQGLLGADVQTVQSGNQTLSVFDFDVAGDSNTFVVDATYGLEQLAEWINQHFGQAIIASSCDICQRFGTDQVAVGTAPLVVGQEPVTIEQPPIVIQGDPVTIEQPPIVVQADPVTVEQPPIVIQGEPVTIELPPITITPEPVIIE